MTSVPDRAEPTPTASSRWLGLDLGGTNIKVAVVARDTGLDEDSHLDVVGRRQLASAADRGPPAVMSSLLSAGIDAATRWGPVAGVGVGVPGLFDADTGCIELFPNLPGPWQGTPVTAPLADALGVSVSIINDARAFTLAETRVGAAAGCRTVAAYVLGTGIGGGIVVDGRLHLGPHGRAGELGHCVVEPDGPRCGCGNRGCLEAVATSGALARLAGQPSADATFAAAAAGDRRAHQAIDRVTDAFGLAIANMVTVLIPERVVIGGGVAAAGAALFEPLRAAVARHQTLVPPDWYQIVPARLGAYAGAIGAALWAAESAPLPQSVGAPN